MSGIDTLSSWVLVCIPSGVSHRLRMGLTSVGRHSSSRMRILGTHYVSRHHAEIKVSSDNRSVTIKDLNSINGIFVNADHHKSSTVTIQKGDKIGIGVGPNEILPPNQPALPIYELKYLPKDEQNEESSSTETQPTNNIGIKMESDFQSSTSRSSSNAEQKILPNLVVISDDDTDDSPKEKNDSQKILRNETPHSRRLSTLPDDILTKQENNIERTNNPSINLDIAPAEIIISDDDSDDNHRNYAPSFTHNNKPYTVAIKQEEEVDVDNNTTNNKAKSPSMDKNSTYSKQGYDKPLALNRQIDTSIINQKTDFENPNSTSINIDKDQAKICHPSHPLSEKEIQPLYKTSASLEAPKETKPHVPLIPCEKKEIINIVTADVKTIFGDIQDDDDITDKLKEMNPFVYKEITGKNLSPATNMGSHLQDGDCLSVSDEEELDDDLAYVIPSTSNDNENIMETTTGSYDDDMMEEDCFGSIVPATSCSDNKSRVDATSPNIFGSSFDESKEEDKNPSAIDSEKNIGSTDNQNMPGEILLSSMDNINLETYIAKVPVVEDDEDLEEIMFSQALKMDMKAELQDDDFNTNFEKDFSTDDDCFVEALDVSFKNREESDVDTNVSIQDVPWVISDDEDYDEELETKVTDWSNKIFSQSFSSMNLSQIYELGPDNATDDEGEEHDSGMNEQRRVADGNIITDLYNSNENEYPAATDMDVEFENFGELVRQVDEIKSPAIQEKGYSKEIQEIRFVNAKDILQTDTKEIGSSKLRGKKVHKRENKKENNEKRSNLKSVKVVVSPPSKEILKSFEVTDKPKMSPFNVPDQSTSADSPLIRTRKNSCSRSRRLDSSSSSSSEDDIKSTVSADRSLIQTVGSVNENMANRQKPIVIDAPSLPKSKGKLRGVSAVKPVSGLVNNECDSKNALKEKMTSIRDRIISDRLTKDLRSKWVEKPSASRKRDREREKIIKETRKDKLKELAKKSHSPTKEAQKRKTLTSADSTESRAKKAKVKLTTNNRGSFLVNIECPEIKPKENFKIPQISKHISNNKQNATEKKLNETVDKIKHTRTLMRCQSLDSIKINEPLNVTNNFDATFSQLIAMPDELLLKKVNVDVQKQVNKTVKPKRPDPKPKQNVTLLNGSSKVSEAKPKEGAMCKEAAAARALRTTNKITFASMEHNITATESSKEKLSIISAVRSTPNLVIVEKKKTVLPKKVVRFNDVPIIHYIERIYGASRKIMGKDILPQTTYKDRQLMIRRNYPIIDKTHKIISMILLWSNEWLVKRNAAVDAASDVVYPMPNNFSSFDQYISILFPLMKLEYVSLLEREYKISSCVKKYTVIMDYVTENTDRFTLVTKFYFSNRLHLESTKYDLVILESKQMNNSMFAYLAAKHNGTGSCNNLVFEILPTNITKEFFVGIKEFTVRPVIDNVRVEFGTINAVYQLVYTPLFQKILNPSELLHSRPLAKKRPIYRGFDMLNENQTHVLINTYSRIIDETTPNISLLQGPPGTGKSCVISNLALQTLYGDEVRYLDKKILICAQSNAAVDVIAAKLYDVSMRMRIIKRFRLIRYGLPEKINPKLHPVSLSHMVERERIRKLIPENSNVQVQNKENLKQQILELEAQIADMSKRNVKGTVEEDMLLKKQEQLKMMRSIEGQLIRPEDERAIFTWYLCNAHIICATLSSCVKLANYVSFFDVCIIDEATQSTEPMTLLPLRFGITSLILAGDTQQLPATILSKKANELGLGKSMFTRIQNCLESVSIGTSNADLKSRSVIYSLQTQYRMHPEICRWPNQYFYRNELINDRITMTHSSPILPFSVLNLAYTQNEHCPDGKITNNLEAEFVAELLKALDDFLPNKCNTYGVITPYAQHRVTLEKSIRSLGLNNIMVNTIDSYQGMERDVIVISNARTTGIGFLCNPQRLNVALTRPKKCLILCGNFKSLEVVPAWRSLLESAKERNVFFEISTSCINDIQTNVIKKIKIKN